MVVQDQAGMGEGSTNSTNPHHTPTFIQPSTSQPQKKQKPRKPKRKDTQIPQSSGPTEHVVDEAVYKELDNSLVMAVTTTSSLEVKQDSGNIIKTRSKAIPNEAGSQGTTSDGGPRRQETMGDTIAQARFENVSKLSNDLLLIRGNTLQSGEDSLKLKELMELSMVESFGDKESLGEDASKQGRINAIDADEDIILVNDQDDADMFDVNTLASEEVFVAEQSGNVVEEVVVVIDVANYLSSARSLKLLRGPFRLDEELAFKLQAEEEEEEEEQERLAREKAQQIKEANIAWDDVQAKVEADYQLAQRLQAQEQEELTDEEKARLFVQFLEQRRKHFAAKRVEEKRNKPPTQAQQRKIMCTYLKNMEGKKPKDLKNKSFDSIQKMFDRAFKRGRIVGIKRLFGDLRITTAQVCVTAAKLKNFMPPKHDLSLSGIEEFINEPIVSEPTVKNPVGVNGGGTNVFTIGIQPCGSEFDTGASNGVEFNVNQPQQCSNQTPYVEKKDDKDDTKGSNKEGYDSRL
ncbi:hypothetical protein Tco_1247625 [Tanacetum coccineum]